MNAIALASIPIITIPVIFATAQDSDHKAGPSCMTSTSAANQNIIDSKKTPADNPKVMMDISDTGRAHQAFFNRISEVLLLAFEILIMIDYC
ncbi:hypothetical protein [Undibacterium oligocarboniphilum]|uniref:Uncharacterized protein n=1 Tax=Undibacterium oligocarboniphilum TaxID=666702 RepID=A0A850QEL9_9BURK|nr:hypothetical protein [Undibacterium oligocarboniphilum]MBC3871512.1 hypothetical protein [Undibacterium oligocarboniphilum]NVO78912.1 hypothetical protein [Undibacterium oligocarboniphilum]